jgi:hypothetical protein
MVPVHAILRKTQRELHKYLQERLAEFYPTTVISTNSYLMAEGTIPILLIAHLDTVFPDATRHDMQIYYDRSQKVMWSPDGLGTDDRAGVILILKLLEEGYRPHLLFTHDEELGGLGAIDFVFSKGRPNWDIRYMIELDRMGYDDCVFYSCGNQEFIDYITSFGFYHTFGTFSDISTLMPYLGIAGVNLSVGYMDEHTYGEHWHLDWANSTYYKVAAMLSAPPDTTFKYIEDKHYYDYSKVKIGNEDGTYQWTNM